jgi:hypothetical protein
MIKELAWYLDDNRFSNLVKEMQGTIDTYAAARQAREDEDTLTALREEVRVLFEDHAVRSGVRDEAASYINIDAEFFDKDRVNQEALDTFMKEVMKGHCYQKVLWTYMGTTGNFTQISKSAMKEQGLRYEDYLPIAYKKEHPPKKPYNGNRTGREVPVYIYGDGTIREEYIPEKAGHRFDLLSDKSGVNWRQGYDPNGEVKKEGWHGAFDKDGTWTRVEDREGLHEGHGKRQAKCIEVVKDGDTAILYDPGMVLLTAEELIYLTENGEPYGGLKADAEGTVALIEGEMRTLGVRRIGAVGGMKEGTPEIAEAYKKVLGNAAADDLRIADKESVEALREDKRRLAEAAAAESAGVLLYRRIRMAEERGAAAEGIERALSEGVITVPLSPVQSAEDARILGIREGEREAIAMYAPEDEGLYSTMLANIFASWEEYEAGGKSREEIAKLASEKVSGRSGGAGELTTGVSLERIIRGAGDARVEGALLARTGIPGVFREPETVDFYDTRARTAYLGSLERKKVLPRGGAAAAEGLLAEMPVAEGEKKERINRGLTRSLGQYKAIAGSTGLPLGEVIGAVSAAAEGKHVPALEKQVYYDLDMDKVLEEAGKENYQKREVEAEGPAAEEDGAVEVVIGGVGGIGLPEAGFDRLSLQERYGYTEEEAAKAEEFLYDIRLADTGVAETLSPVLAGVVQGTGPEGLRQGILGALDGRAGVRYNLAGSAGMGAYMMSRSFAGSGLSREGLQDLVRLGERAYRGSEPVQAPDIRTIEPRYRSTGGAVSFRRSSPRGIPERAVPAWEYRRTMGADTIPSMPEVPVYSGKNQVPLDRATGNNAGIGTVSVPLASGTAPSVLPAAAGIPRAGAPVRARPGKEPDIRAPDGEPGGVMSGTPPVGGEQRQGRRDARDAELERLRRMEANYEKDKAMLRREKAPALARSESHDVGHAEREGDEYTSSKKTVLTVSDKLVDSLKKRAGV